MEGLTKSLIRRGRYASLLLFLFARLAPCEVLPIGQSVRLFDPAVIELPTTTRWHVTPLPDGRTFLPVISWSSFSKKELPNPGGPVRFSDLPFAKDAIVRVTGN